MLRRNLLYAANIKAFLSYQTIFWITQNAHFSLKIRTRVLINFQHPVRYKISKHKTKSVFGMKENLMHKSVVSYALMRLWAWVGVSILCVYMYFSENSKDVRNFLINHKFSAYYMDDDKKILFLIIMIDTTAVRFSISAQYFFFESMINF